MKESTVSNIDYAIERLKEADASFMSPLIYALWGGLVALSFMVTAYSDISIGTYWVVALPVGMLLSAWIGITRSNKLGQRNSSFGKLTFAHFSIMAIFMLASALGNDPASGILILGMAYCLGAIHIDKWMSVFGVCCLLAYIGISTEFIASNLILGILLCGGLFATSILASLSQKQDAEKLN